jgi:hypothetical protein
MSLNLPAGQVARIRSTLASIGLQVTSVSAHVLNLGAQAALVIDFLCPFCGPHRIARPFRNVQAFIDYTNRPTWEPAALHLRDEALGHPCHPPLEQPTTPH